MTNSLNGYIREHDVFIHFTFENPSETTTTTIMFYFDGEEGQIKAETMEIAVCLICQLSSSNEHYLQMKKQVDHLIHRHEILFTGLVRKLDTLSETIGQNEQNRQDILDDYLCRDVNRIFDSLIDENQVTWGKIITILAFSKFIAQKHSDIADRIAHLTGQYMVKKLIPWIQENGGWKSLALTDSPSDSDQMNNSYFVALSCLGLSLIGFFLASR